MIDWIEKASKEEQEMLDLLSYQDYIDQFEKHPKRELRTTFNYLKDMFEHYGVNEDGSYKVFDQEHNDSPAVYGQSKVQKAIVQNLENFKEEGFNNKKRPFLRPFSGIYLFLL